jgi:hypothetical protein
MTQKSVPAESSAEGTTNNKAQVEYQADFMDENLFINHRCSSAMLCKIRAMHAKLSTKQRKEQSLSYFLT